MTKYTLKQIKEAFWKQFHESGEIWFGSEHCGGVGENEEITNGHWDEFVEELEKGRK